jgi:two-component system sensor histidine kinase UhpB
LTNVARHADATQVELRLDHRRGEAVLLTVRDDGRGIHPGALPSSRGIRGMRERAMLIGAQLEIDSRPDRGTAINLSIPLGPETP